jgi:putative ABC transport system permease protein
VSWIRRITNVFRGEKLDREIDEEIASHMDEARADGRDTREARRALGSPLKLRDEMHDAHVLAWLDSLRADAVYGWRRLARSKVTTAAAVISLGLAIGACTAAFRLVDALMLTPLPIKAPHELYSLARKGIGPEGKPQISDYWDYPLFLRMRDGVKDEAELIACAYVGNEDVTYSTDDAMEKVYWGQASGWMFDSFGPKPAAGRLLRASDDSGPAAKPVAVLSERYWELRFGRDPRVIGRNVKWNNKLYEIVGVVAAPFTGLEPGVMTDVFAPMSANDMATNPHTSWFRTFVRVPEGRSPERVRAELDPIVYAVRNDEFKNSPGMTEQAKRDFLNQSLVIAPAATGVSDFREDNRDALVALSVLVGLVLLIACTNVANLMTAQAASRERELAMRVSIGGGRRRLVQLVLVESAWIGLMASVLGAAFAWWAAPIVIALNSTPDTPVQLALPADWRVLGFAVGLTFIVTLLFGLAPALRASKVDPASALKGGEDPHARRRTMHVLIGAQVAFCFLVVFASGMFVATFERLSHKPTGFSADRVLTLDVTSDKKHHAEEWDALLEHVQHSPGVESASLATWALMNGAAWNDSIAFNGGPPNDALGYFLTTSPEWPQTMKIPLVEGRKLRAGAQGRSEAVVNREFVKTFYHGEDPVGTTFEDMGDNGVRTPYTVVGVVGDACYRDLRTCVMPVALLSFRADDPYGKREDGIRNGTLIVKTDAQDPSSMAVTLRQAVLDTHMGFRVSNARTQQSINDIQTMRERMLAMIAIFFAAVALVLAGVGLYGVMNYSVLQRQREIGVRIAVGAQAYDIARSVVARTAVMVLAGTVVGVGAGLAASKSFEALLYQVKATSLTSVAAPCVAIFVAAVLAALPAVIHAVRIDPVILLRSE